MQISRSEPITLRRLMRFFGWTKHSSILLGGFFLVILLILYVWWPLAEAVLSSVDWEGPWWLYMDWLLLGVFFFMSLTIIAGADLRTDALIVLVGTVGGLVIESWGTQTNLWIYYTAERPPLWIIPAWPIAALATDRLMRLLNHGVRKLAKAAKERGNFGVLYWFIFGGFTVLMLFFVAPTFDKSLTLMAILLCALLILSPTDYRLATLTFLAGAGLGYFLELWGTTRECWTYYTRQTPPLFAVLAHGMASVAFWRANLILGRFYRTLKARQGSGEGIKGIGDKGIGDRG
jgi:hypothetical protein